MSEHMDAPDYSVGDSVAGPQTTGLQTADPQAPGPQAPDSQGRAPSAAPSAAPNAADEELTRRGMEFLQYLSSVARNLQGKIVRDVHSPDAQGLLPIDASWNNPYVRIGPTDADDAWLVVQKVARPVPPALPDELAGLVDEGSLTADSPAPRLSDIAVAQLLDDSLEQAEQQLELWTESTWKPWRQQSHPAIQAYKLYTDLYAMRLAMEGNEETKEIVWGNAFFHYDAPDGEHVDYPLVTTTMSIDMSRKDGSIRVEADGSPELSFAPLENLGIPGMNDLVGLQRAYASAQNPAQEDDDATAIPVWDDGLRQKFEERIVAPLGLDAKAQKRFDSRGIAAHPVVSDETMLFIRPIPRLEEQFYDNLSDLIDEGGIFPAALDSTVVNQDTVASSSQYGRYRDAISAQTIGDGKLRVLMPLPSNDEQQRIAEQLEKSIGVAVQGPPGTGKTHTIANLVSHLLAQGKRVLVTAEKEQALTVLQEKIPESIRDLTISVGTSVESMAKLSESVQHMQDTISDIDVEGEKQRITALEQQLDSLESDMRLTEARLDQALMSETREFTIPDATGDKSRPAGQVAKWIRANAGIDVIADAVQPDVRFPLTAEDYAHFVALCQSITPQEAAESLFDTAVAQQLPDAASIDSAFRELDAIGAKIGALQSSGLRVDALETLPEGGLESLVQTVEDGAARVGAIETRPDDAALYNALFASGRYTADNVAWLRAQNRELWNKAAVARQHEDHLLGHAVVVPAGPKESQLQLLSEWSTRMKPGGKLGMFAPKELKDFAGAVRVDGFAVVNAEQLGLVRDQIIVNDEWTFIVRMEQQVYGRFGFDAGVSAGRPDFATIANFAQRIEDMCGWGLEGMPALGEMLRTYVAGAGAEPMPDSATLRHIADLLKDFGISQRAGQLEAWLTSIMGVLDAAAAAQPAVTLWNDFRTALATRDAAAWAAACQRMGELARVREDCIRREALGERIASAGAPMWRDAMERGEASALLAPADAPVAWRVAQARTWLGSLYQGPSVESLMEDMSRKEAERKDVTLRLIHSLAYTHLKENRPDSARRHLADWLEAIKKIGKGTGKKAPRYIATARAMLPQAMGAVPVWIMPLHRVFQNFVPGQSEPFDVVIVDESSQCDLLSVGVLALARQAVIVGDDKQTSPNRVGIDESMFGELQNRYIGDFGDRALYGPNESLYSLATRAFGSVIQLREHYRCVPEIIEYSNRFYDGNIQPLRERTHPQIGDPLHAVYCEDCVSRKAGNFRVNEGEARRIVDTLVECLQKPEYADLSFGIVTFMSGDQKKIIQNELLERVSVQDIEKHRIRVGYPPDFQGDERDVVFISMVTHISASTEGARVYAATSTMYQQWANVAVSRARDQLWVFYSMDYRALNPNDVRRGIIEYVAGYREETRAEDKFALVESDFERDVLRDILRHGYDVQPQYQVGRYRIDFVVTLAPGYRLAIECDGDSYHGLDRQDSDLRRQRVLERQGWNFWRIRASEYYLDPGASMMPLWSRLEDLRQRAEDSRGA